ncbi:uncharacterized protein RYa [Drosophila virilis]|uniref:RYamide n=1 Tax=Drosophila virilis TaxID=7244 RepID=B4LPG8_DROVI|nr:uncharacterized protein LOC6626127 [Drosophila virilis]EDW61227.1 uncharacterized protein Dvir_GJ21914 [Drosophila virilis]
MSQAFQRQSRKSLIGILLLTFWAFLAQGVLASAYADELHKENDFPTLAKRPAFFVGSRYGRSSGNSGAGGNGAASNGMGTSKTRRLIIVPRNDRFFLGSRYGKRSDEYLSPYEQNSLGLGLGKGSLREAEPRSVESDEKPSSIARTSPIMTMTMSCVYTGISNFYRCSNVNTEELNNMVGRSDGVTLDSNSIASEDANTNIK